MNGRRAFQKIGRPTINFWKIRPLEAADEASSPFWDLLGLIFFFSYSHPMFEAEKRQSPRRTLRVRATLTGRDGSQLDVRTYDLSVTGVCVLSEQPLPLKEHCSVTFQLLTNGVRNTFNGDGQIVYCMLAGPHFKSGIQFASLPAQSRTIIESFLDASLW